MIKFPAAKLVMSPDITDDYSNLNKDYFQPSRKNLFNWEFWKWLWKYFLGCNE